MTILVVDDHEQNRYQLQVLLGGDGYQVVTAADGAEALAQARQNPPDLIVSDILMPVMDGFSLCREWKKDEQLMAIPFVFYTATYTDERDRELALSLGAARFIVKPEEPDTFIQLVREAIEHAQRSPAAPAGLPIPAPAMDETGHLKQYSEVLIRKLEAKMEQLEQANRALDHDIDARKRTEAALRESEERYRSLVEMAPDAIAIHGDGRLLYINRRGAVALGAKDPEELVGLPLERLVHPQHWPATRERIRRMLAGTPDVYPVEDVYLRLDGTALPVETAAAPVTFQGRKAIQVIARDITERKQAEARLAEQLDELRRWHDATLGREARVLDLKKEVNELLAQAGQPPRYPSAVEGSVSDQ
jgi:PAS domain S-box-containing protein